MSKETMISAKDSWNGTWPLKIELFEKSLLEKSLVGQDTIPDYILK
tara:strand:- start:521 stop:658 length:138 start_codon:yes stop_codon:yes gene_type:complete